MQILDILSQVGGVQALAREFGLSEQQAASGAEALAPAVLGGFQKQAQAPSAGGLDSLLAGLGGGGLLDRVVAPEPTDPTPGNEVLGQIFGSKDVSRTVAQHASAQTGLDPSLLKKMLPMIAMLVAGYLARRPGGGGLGGMAGGGGGLGDLLGGLLGGRSAGAQGGGGGGLGSLLDRDGNGNPLDDILRMAARGMR